MKKIPIKSFKKINLKNKKLTKSNRNKKNLVRKNFFYFKKNFFSYPSNLKSYISCIKNIRNNKFDYILGRYKQKNILNLKFSSLRYYSLFFLTMLKYKRSGLWKKKKKYLNQNFKYKRKHRINSIFNIRKRSKAAMGTSYFFVNKKYIKKSIKLKNSKYRVYTKKKNFFSRFLKYFYFKKSKKMLPLLFIKQLKKS